MGGEHYSEYMIYSIIMTDQSKSVNNERLNFFSSKLVTFFPSHSSRKYTYELVQFVHLLRPKYLSLCIKSVTANLISKKMVDFSLQTGFDNRPPYCMIAHTTVCSNFFSNGCSLSPSWNKLYSEILRGHPWFIFRNKSTNIIIVLLLVNYTCWVHISTKNKPLQGLSHHLDWKIQPVKRENY